MPRTRRHAVAASLCVVALLPYPARSASPPTYVETFNTTTYRDVTGTNAFWDTGTGELKFFSFNPFLNGTYNTSGTAWRVAVAGDHAYVPDDVAGLQIVSILNPALPTLTGNFNTSGTAFDVVVAGDLAFVADGASGVQIINILSPAVPTLTGTFNTSGFALGVAVGGDHLFVADGASGLQIISILNPAAPALVGTFNTSGSAAHVELAGDLAFVADGASGLQIINISNPALPTLTGTYNTPGDANRVVVDGDRVLIADDLSGLHIVNVSNPASPTLLGALDTPGNAIGVAAQGTVALVADGASGLLVVDVNNPASPFISKTLDTTGSAFGVAMAGRRAFVADGASGLHIVDFATTALPRELSSYGVELNANAVAVAGDYAAVCGIFDGLQLMNIADPTNPILLGTYTETAHDVALAGDLAFVACDLGGLVIVNISNPASPTLVDNVGTGGNAKGIAVSGDLAFLAEGTVGGLTIFNIANPAVTLLLSTHDTPGNCAQIVWAGDLVYIADGASGLRIVDVTNPALPVLRGTYNTPGSGFDIAVSGDLAFVADGNSGLQIISVANPVTPVLVSTFNPGSTVREVVSAGDLVVISTDAGLMLVDITNPAVPVAAGFYPVPGGIALAGEHAFVVNDDLKIVEVLNHEFLTTGNRAQSITINPIAGPIVRTKFSATQIGTVAWDYAVDDATTWTPIVANGLWNIVATPDDNLRWRAILSSSSPGFNPTVFHLVVDWLYDFSLIGTITDVPADQGGWVQLETVRSGRDFPDEPSLPIVNYGIWRRVDTTAMIETLSSVPRNAAEVPSQLTETFGALPLFAHDGETFVDASSFEDAATFPPGVWQWVGSVPALQQDTYLAVVPTAYLDPTTFVVTAHTTTPSIWYVGPIQTGQSIDNIAPGVPTSFMVAYNTGSGNTLSWDPAPESDFQYYRVYRTTDPTCTLVGASLVHETATIGWSDPDFDGGPIYYIITALDYAGNESGLACGTPASDVDDSRVPEQAALYQNYPNPFNPSTQIRYDVPRGGANVSLAIYDVSGRRVRALVSGRQAAGQRSIGWDGRDDTGAAVATGVYFYRATIGGFASTQKMVLLK